jgi:putative heme-binding domain-containing protein
MKPFAPLFLLVIAVTAHAIEPWADNNLPVQHGLALWLDASVEAKAARAEGAVFEKDNVPRGVWHDASGNRRHVRQEKVDAQPKFGSAYPAKIFSFDGKAQHFSVRTEDLTLKEATLFVYARVRSNEGGFRGLVAAGANNVNDYRSGLNLDLGSGSSDAVEAVSVEGAGFSAERNLLRQPLEFGRPFAAAVVIGPKEVKLYRGTQAQDVRPRVEASELKLDQWLVGARRYDNTGSPPAVRSFFHGDMFELLVYDRALNDAEVRRVATYLESKYAGVVFVAAAKNAQSAGSVPLVAAKNPPVIQPLVPGFTTRKLPVELTNINFLRYRADGRLYAGAYDGKIWLLRDTDNDGLEDKTELFYASNDLKAVMGMALTPPGDARGEGVFVATRGRVLLILDKDKDGKGDEVVTVAEGWAPAKVTTQGVSDALGVAVAADGRVFFTLGTSDFTSAYLLDAATGRAAVLADGERGSVQEVSADFKTRTTYANGLRFNYGLAFNRAGDLFATEQEGATWLANGNPFDELLHIQPRRYYGFPPRHPRHLPDVIDEPSTFDYGPQHQSTVGLCFDEPATEGGPLFGPAWWRGDALLSAMSRGKIYRTKLVKTDAGYVAKNETFAQLQRINIDQAISPRGALTVTLHSGAPDWGTGPTGTGELWQITPIAKATPQPVIACSASPTELRVVFDQPLDAAALAAMQGKVSVTQGRYVQAGDRFETMRPGYQVVKNQLNAARYPVAVQKLALSEDAHSLLITTPTRGAAVNYGITIATDAFQTQAEGVYAGQVDLQADLTGVEATLADGSTHWLPHPDLAVSRELFPQSPVWSRLEQTSAITLRGQLDLGLMLYPAVQEGSKLDWEYPEEKVTVVITAARSFKFTLGKDAINSQPVADRHKASAQVSTKAGSWLPFTIALDSGRGAPALTATWFTDRSTTPRPFPLRRVLVPYAQQQEAPAMPHNEDLPQLANAKWENGKVLFQNLCANCHSMQGAGSKVGPDLTNLIYRDYDSVLRDIREPNAAINPEHVAYNVTKKDGSELTAVLSGENEGRVSLALPGGQTLKIPRSEISTMKQLATSIMPAGLDQALNADQRRDLMAYLLLPPFEAAPLMIEGAPPPRKRSEVQAILGDKLTAPIDTKHKPLRIVLCASEKDKGHAKPGYHDYPLWRSRWTRLLGMAPGITVEQATDWPTSEQWAKADVIAINSHNPAWSSPSDAAALQQRTAELDAFLARGGGFVSIHWSVNAGANVGALAQRLGLAWGKGARYRHGANDWVLNKTHPLAAGFETFQIPDESYWHLTGDLAAAKANVLATSIEEAAPTPQMWTREVGPGRVFVSIPGHFSWTHDDPLYRILILRGMMWTARQPLDRLAPLSVIGARVEN